MEDCGELFFVAFRTLGTCEFEEKNQLPKFDKLLGLLDQNLAGPTMHINA